jgi:hypothetical protein
MRCAKNDFARIARLTPTVHVNLKLPVTRLYRQVKRTVDKVPSILWYVFTMGTFLLRATECTASLLTLSLFLAGQETPKKPTTIIDFVDPIVETSHIEAPIIDIDGVDLLSRHGIGDDKKQIVFKELRETSHGRIVPSSKFDVICKVRGDLSLSTENFLLWTSVDFLIAPLTETYEKMDNEQIGLSVSWGQLTEMDDFKSAPIYSLDAGETRRVVVKDFDLTKTLASFSADHSDNLWPWLVRVNVHIQDRAGKQVASANKIVRLWPDSGRRSHASGAASVLKIPKS